MAEETPGDPKVRAILLDDVAQVRRWAAILGGQAPRRPSQRLSRYLRGAGKSARPEGLAGRVGIGGRPET